VVGFGQRVLPQQLFVGHLRAQVARQRAHVTVDQLVPGTGEGIGQLVGVILEALGDRPVDRVEAQRQVRGEHGRCMLLARIVGIRHGACAFAILWSPLVRTGRALGQFPLEVEQVVEVLVAPTSRRRRPGHLQAAGNGIPAFASAKTVGPAEALQFEARRFRFRAYIVGRTGTVGLAEGMAARDQRHGFFVVHRHPAERFANIPA